MADVIIDLGIATIIVGISIIISGICIGVGKAAGHRGLMQFGSEELAQSFINGALVGGFALIIAAAQAVSGSMVVQPCGNATMVIDSASCMIDNVNTEAFSMFNSLARSMDMVGYYQSMRVDFGQVSIQPFVNLKSLSDIYASQAMMLQTSIMLSQLNKYILSFFSTAALGVFLPLGIILRSFFATRRIGGFLIALSLGLFLVYPAFILVFPEPTASVKTAHEGLALLANNTAYMAYPIAGLGSNGMLAQKLDNMSAANFTSDLAYVSQVNANAISNIFFFTVFAPLLALVITIVFVKELSKVLGGEFAVSFGVI